MQAQHGRIAIKQRSSSICENGANSAVAQRLCDNARFAQVVRGWAQLGVPPACGSSCIKARFSVRLCNLRGIARLARRSLFCGLPTQAAAGHYTKFLFVSENAMNATLRSLFCGAAIAALSIIATAAYA
jgi:hypothetical protein